MSEQLEGGNTTAVTQNGVTVERHLDRRDDGIIVTLELSADVRGPAEVDLVDEFPPELPVEQTGFNVDHEPRDGEVSLERVELHHVIEEETETIVYAIRLSEAADDVEFGPPEIREVELPGIPEPDVPEEAEEDDEEPLAGGEDAAATPEDGGAPPAGAEPGGGEPEPASGPETATDGEGLPEGLSLGDLDEESADDEPGPDDEEPGPELSLDGLEPDEDDADRIESALESAETPDSGGGGAGSDAGGAGTGTDAGDAGAGTDAAPDPMDAGGAAPDPMANGGTPEQNPATDTGPAREGASGDAAPMGGSVPRSVKLRLDRLNARVEEFAAYAEALEEIIERHGTAPEILENIESDLASADERISEVRGELESLRSRHDADVSEYREDVEALESRLSEARRDLESEVEDVRADLEGDVEDVKTALEGEVADVREALEADVEDVRYDLQADVADVRRDLEAVEQVRADVDDVAAELEAVSAEVDAVDDRIDDHESELRALDETVADLGETVEGVADDVSAVAGNVEAMRSEIEALQHDVDNLLRFREILADVFGGPVRRATEGAGAPAEDGEDGPGSAADRQHQDERSGGGPSSPPTGPSG